MNTSASIRRTVNVARNALVLKESFPRAVAVANASVVPNRTFIKPAYDLAKKVMPRISATEAAALDAGTVGFDRDLFSGSPSLSDLKQKYSVELSTDERAFMENEVQQLCEMLDDYQISRDRDLPVEVWNFIKEKKFLGMIIPKEYGGLGFTGHGHSQVVQKLSSRSGSAAVSVMVPNSLGPGELLMRYGTQEQKDYFLPRLAKGEMIPCFGLTGPASGSDAAAMRDAGVVEERDGVLGIRATFKKRYITLAPIAGVVGLAFVVRDPQGLLKGCGTEGISVALLERGHPGLRIGDRHDPLAAAFMNGTVEGEDVFIPMEKLIGGQERAGFGWNMLMDCLAEGRGISLPALSVAAGKMSCGTVGAYARVRKQFKVPIAELEGVQEHLARIAGNTFIMTSAQHLVNAMINQHEQPAVVSAIMKQQMTDRMRTIVNDSMDVLGGAGICNGPANFMANAYCAVPIAITVEGANTLTRSLIQYGQGLMRSHPHLLPLVRSVQAGDDMKGFNQHLAAMVKHGVSNSGAALARALFRSRSKSDLEGYYESQLNRFAAGFAFSADLSLTLGGKIKFAEMLSGRYADVLSNLYLGYATLWFHSQNKMEGSEKVLEYAMSNILCDMEEAFEGICQNFPIRPVGWLMTGVVMPTGRSYSRPGDRLVSEVSRLITTDSAVRQLLSRDVFVSEDPTDRVHLLHATLPKALKADAILSTLRKEKRNPTAEEQVIIDEAEAAREIIIQVDSFPRLGRELALESSWTQDQRPAVAGSSPTQSSGPSSAAQA
mmetsp:Transcript_22053/g.32009  ORF Transcript_22053/g.32009 Transcript_22053/m.32009 type:complete len:775 (-) Transcript_22053:62-2386(-)|eukprot:CAMPEP_0113938902 /NCGR_PEP_ID=MMETSP1339-20121228/5315_1 /TAXON_ID=94617 /ORGANISM="Fibrocapsa japonica" /LENGTH=774 /DNA_ID=CAMNT_0000942229 /DNA_START=53 /DNA_END=2377 /DNA_ORIENTATION=+ /assembly_acc=CAM_ASM_000762